MNYAVFWDTEKTVVLYGSDIGVYAYRVTTEKQLIKAPIDYKLGEKLKNVQQENGEINLVSQ